MRIVRTRVKYEGDFARSLALNDARQDRGDICIAFQASTGLVQQTVQIVARSAITI